MTLSAPPPPPQIAGFNPMRLFLWGYLKSKVYITPPDSIDGLKNKLSVAIESLKQDEELIRRSVRDMIRRVNTCMDVQGRHIELLLENK